MSTNAGDHGTIAADAEETGPELVPSPDDEGRYDDSAYAASISVNSASLTSSVQQFRTEHGRTYHSYGSRQYWGPNDEEAKEHQDFANHVYLLGLNGKYWLAPIESPKNILDLGCGTGIWCMQVGDEHQDATVKGIDLSPTMPQWVPPNVHFEVDDYNEDWLARDKYDLIHAREILGSVPDWVELYRKAFVALQPGGWMDHIEPDFIHAEAGKLPDDHAFSIQESTFRDVEKRTGMSFHVCELMKSSMEAAGFVNVRETRMKFPIGAWPKDPTLKTLGKWNLVRCDMGIRDWNIRSFASLLGWSTEELEVLFAHLRKEFRNRAICPVHYVVNVCGQKPEAST